MFNYCLMIFVNEVPIFSACRYIMWEAVYQAMFLTICWSTIAWIVVSSNIVEISCSKKRSNAFFYQQLGQCLLIKGRLNRHLVNKVFTVCLVKQCCRNFCLKKKWMLDQWNKCVDCVWSGDVNYVDMICLLKTASLLFEQTRVNYCSI